MTLALVIGFIIYTMCAIFFWIGNIWITLFLVGLVTCTSSYLHLSNNRMYGGNWTAWCYVVLFLGFFIGTIIGRTIFIGW